MFVAPADKFCGDISIPGDKSISHRSAMLASIAEGKTIITNFLDAEDCLSTLHCLRQLGIGIERDGTTVVVKGNGLNGLQRSAGILDCGNSGTTARTIAGILAGQPFRSTLTGDESLTTRPMRRIISPLEKLGANVASNDGLLPITLGEGQLNGRTIRLEVASAQVKTCILLAGLFAYGTTTVIEPIATRDHTERMLSWFGADVVIDNSGRERHISVAGNSMLTAQDITVPGDISSAAFLTVAAACLPNSEVIIRNVGLNPTRTGILSVLEQCGVSVDIENETDRCNEPIGDLTVRSNTKLLSPAIIDGNVVANVIDELPIIAVLGTQLPDGIEVRGAAELRVKETDRIDAVVRNLRAIGVDVDEFDDGFRVRKSNIVGGEVDSFGDHRIAMAFAVAGLLSNDGVTIINAACTDISFPGFFETLTTLVE